MLTACKTIKPEATKRKFFNLSSFPFIILARLHENWTDTCTKVMKLPAATAQYAIWWTTTEPFRDESSAWFDPSSQLPKAMNVLCRARVGNCFIEALSDDWSKLKHRKSCAFSWRLMIGEADRLTNKSTNRTMSRELLYAINAKNARDGCSYDQGKSGELRAVSLMSDSVDSALRCDQNSEKRISY